MLTLSKSSLGMVRSLTSIPLSEVKSFIDYGESHYIGPIKGAQPDSEAWVNGFDHMPWLHLCRHFVSEFKSDSKSLLHEPRETYIYVWARPHPREVDAVSDMIGRPDNWQLVSSCSKFSIPSAEREASQTDDTAWIVLLTGERGMVEIVHLSSSSTSVVRQAVERGVNLLSYPLVKQGRICIRFRARNSETSSVEFAPRFEFNLKPDTYNFNAYVEMHPRAEWK